MGNFLAMSREDKVVQIMRNDGKILELRTPILVRDLMENNPNTYVGLFKEAIQPLPVDYRLKMGKIYYLLPCVNNKTIADEPVNGKVLGGSKRIKVVIRRDQLQQMLAQKQVKGGFEFDDQVLFGVNLSRDCGSDSDVDGSSSNWLPKLESIPEGNEVVNVTFKSSGI